MAEHINLVGIELEGWWTKARSPKNPIHDRSVVFDQIETGFVGETASPALAKDQIKTWIDENYPNKTNDTCGVHVHISVRSDKDYVRLMSKEFEQFFHDRMNIFGKRMEYPEDHPFWCRLKGSNPFCARDFKPEEQVIRTDKRGPRYSQLNYCFGLHGTLECRLFHGSTNPVEIHSMVRVFIDCVEEFLEMPEVSGKDFDKIYEIFESDLIDFKDEDDDLEDYVVPYQRRSSSYGNISRPNLSWSFDDLAPALDSP